MTTINPEKQVTCRLVGVTDRLPRRALYCALLNNEAFAAGQEEVTL